MRRFQGHLWTLWPYLYSAVRSARPPAGRPWRLAIEDQDVGRIELTGRLRPVAGAESAVILVHGLGGSAESRYLPPAVRAAETLGLTTLRLNLRGSDLEGHDLYHAGLWSDLAAVVGSDDLAGYRRLYILGFSLGGHLALHYATAVDDPRLRAVAAVCTPLDMECAQRNFDRRSCWPYRRFILHSLKQIYERIAARRPVPHSPDALRRVHTIREYDALTVVPRFGFASPEDYYREVSVGRRLGALQVPALLVDVEGDPMVPPETVRPWLEHASPLLEAHFVRGGGHVTFPADLDLGFEAPRGIESQLLHWLIRQ